MASTPSRISETLSRETHPELPEAGRKVSYEEFFERTNTWSTPRQGCGNTG
ncbi:MAG: hypothetical protein ACE5LU_15915 [Anaerolineae bacterium]